MKHDMDRRRGVKVKIDGKDNWAFLNDRAAQQVLEFYDTAQPKDKIKNVNMGPPTGHVYDYRFEGGRWLTQHNPVNPAAAVREVHVVYTGNEEFE